MTKQPMNQNNPIESVEGEILDTAALMQITKAELSQQGEWAIGHLRNTAQARNELREMATHSPAMASKMFYSIPKQDKGKTVFITGPSIGLARLAVYCWGNMTWGSRPISIEHDHVTAQGFAFDAEKNNRNIDEVKRRIINKNGVRYGIDAIQSTLAAACSIAARNAVFNVIPKPLIEMICQECINVCAKGAKEKGVLNQARTVIGQLENLKVDKQQVFDLMSVTKESELTAEHVAHLQGIINNIEEGAESAESIFGRPQPSAKSGNLDSKMKETLAMQRQSISKDKCMAILGERNSSLDYAGCEEAAYNAISDIVGKRKNAFTVNEDDWAALLLVLMREEKNGPGIDNSVSSRHDESN